MEVRCLFELRDSFALPPGGRMENCLTLGTERSCANGRERRTFWVEIMTLDSRGHEFDFRPPPEQINCEKRLTIKLRESAASQSCNDLEGHAVFELTVG